MSVIYTRYIYPYWVPYQATVTGIITLCTIAIIVYAPESPKYLVVKKRYDDARAVLKRMAEINQKKVNMREIVFEQEVLEGVVADKADGFNINQSNASLGNTMNLSSSFLKDSVAGQVSSPMRRVAEQKKMTGSIKDLVRVKRHFINLMLLTYMWIQNTFCLSMINFYVEHVPGDKYSNFFASNIVEIPAYAMGGVGIHYLGVRKTLYIGASISMLGGVPLIIFGDPKNLKIPTWMFTFLVLFAKGGILVLINCVYISTATFFPPIFSGAAFGVCNTFAKTCSIFGPIVSEARIPIPMSLFSALTSMIFPATYLMRIRKSNDSFSLKEK
jgi:hypothetical protein